MIVIGFVVGALYVLGLFALAKATKDSRKRESEAFESWISEKARKRLTKGKEKR